MAKKQKSQTLYKRLGGADALQAFVDKFYEGVLVDAELKPFFEKTNMDWLKKSQLQFLAQALGGPKNFTGRSIQDSHEELGIGQHHFDLVAGHLVESLAALEIEPELIAEVVAVVAPLSELIVTTENVPPKNSN